MKHIIISREHLETWYRQCQERLLQLPDQALPAELRGLGSSSEFAGIFGESKRNRVPCAIVSCALRNFMDLAVTRLGLKSFFPSSEQLIGSEQLSVEMAEQSNTDVTLPWLLALKKLGVYSPAQGQSIRGRIAFFVDPASAWGLLLRKMREKGFTCEAYTMKKESGRMVLGNLEES